MAIEDFDDLLKTLKTKFWNYLHFATFGAYCFVIPSAILAGAFLAPNVKHECISQPSNVTLNNGSDACRYSYDVTTNNGSTETIHEVCTRWKFDNTDFNDTLTSEFELVCDQSHMRPTFQTSYMIGNCIGSPIAGFLSDKYGRHTIFTAGVFLLTAMSLVSSVLTSFPAILFTRFFVGLSHPAIICCGYILCMEVTEPKLRTAVGIVISLPWSVGTLFFGLIGFYLRDWRWLQRVTVAEAIIFLPLPLIFIGESPRWLIVKGRFKKALKILKVAYKRNNVAQPQDETLMLKMKEIHCNAKLISKENANESDGKLREVKPTIGDVIKNVFRGATQLFSGPEIRRRSLLIFILFLTDSTVFFGLSLNAINYGVNPYLYMAIGGAMEIPSHLIPIPLVKKIGRISPTIWFFAICGVSILVLVFIPSDITWLVVVFAMIAKFCISASYLTSYLIASEVFPTEVRLQGLGAANFVSRLGSIAAPFITDSLDGPSLTWVPSVLFGSLCLAAALATWFLPETLRAHLPDTVNQLEEQTRTGRKLKVEQENCDEDEGIGDVEVEVESKLIAEVVVPVIA